VRVKADDLPAAFELSVNARAQTATLHHEGWSELKLQPATFVGGTNECKLIVKTGALSFDWMDWSN
jgi:hypothetical protein